MNPLPRTALYNHFPLAFWWSEKRVPPCIYLINPGVWLSRLDLCVIFMLALLLRLVLYSVGLVFYHSCQVVKKEIRSVYCSCGVFIPCIVIIVALISVFIPPPCYCSSNVKKSVIFPTLQVGSYTLTCMLPIGRFSEAGLLEWMRFIIFRARSHERSQCTSGPISE